MGAGESWRRKREASGMTLADVARELHISQRYLRDIEEGSFEGWPERVFSTGFIRSYAKLISEDPGPVLMEYHERAGRDAAGPAQAPVRPAWIERERQRGSRVTGYLAAAAAVFAVGLLIAGITWKRAPKSPPAPAAVPAPTAEAARPAALPDNAAPAAADNAPRTDRQDNVSASAPAGRSPVYAVDGVGAVQGPYQLFIEASMQTWMRYAVDGGEPLEVMLYPGDRVNIQAKKRITIKLGNAGGVAATLNGKLLPPFGASGQVKEVTLGE